MFSNEKSATKMDQTAIDGKKPKYFTKRKFAGDR